MRRPGAAVLLVAGIGVGLTACAGAGGRQTPPTTAAKSQTAVPRPQSSAPRLAPLLEAPPVDVAQLRGHSAVFLSPTRLAFLTSGSANCRAVPATLAVENPHAIRIQLREQMPPNGICLQNLVIRPVAIVIPPNQIDVHRRVKVSLYYPKGVIRNYGRPVVFTAPPL